MEIDVDETVKKTRCQTGDCTAHLCGVVIVKGKLECHRLAEVVLKVELDLQ